MRGPRSRSERRAASVGDHSVGEKALAPRARSERVEAARVERLDEGKLDPAREPVARAAVLARIANALDRRRIPEEIAHARDEDADAVFGVRGLGARAAGRAKDLLGRQAVARAAEELDHQRLERAAPLE